MYVCMCMGAGALENAPSLQLELIAPQQRRERAPRIPDLLQEVERMRHETMQMRHVCSHRCGIGQPNLCARIDRTHRSLGNVKHGGSDGDLFKGRRKGHTHCCRRRHRRRRAHAHAEHHQHHDDLPEEIRRRIRSGAKQWRPKIVVWSSSAYLTEGLLFLASLFFPRFSKRVIRNFLERDAWTIQPRSIFSARAPQAWACHSPS